MAFMLASRSLPTPQLENALWEALVALQRHGLDNPHLIDNPDYMAVIRRAQKAWGIVFEAMP